MVTFDEVREHGMNVILDILVSTLSKCQRSAEKDYTQYQEIITLLLDIRFQTDFQLMVSGSDIESVYNRYRVKSVETGNYQIRLLLDLATEIRIFCETDEAYQQLILEIARFLSVHNTINDSTACVYDGSILETLNTGEWARYIRNNSWLLACIVIRYIPQSFYMDKILTLGDKK